MGLTFADSTANEVNCGSAPVLDDLSNVTLCAWIKPTDNANNYRNWAGKGDKFVFFRRGVDGTRLSTVMFGSVNCSVDITAGNVTTGWNFVAFTLNLGTAAVAYWGNESTAVTDKSFGAAAGTAPRTTDATSNFTIGSDQGDAANVAAPYTFAWVGLWTPSLTLAQIEDQRLHPTVTPGNILFMRFNSNNTTGERDQSGLANHGTITGATVATTADPVGVIFNHPIYRGITRPRMFQPGLPR